MAAGGEPPFLVLAIFERAVKKNKNLVFQAGGSIWVVIFVSRLQS